MVSSLPPVQLAQFDELCVCVAAIIVVSEILGTSRSSVVVYVL